MCNFDYNCFKMCIRDSITSILVGDKFIKVKLSVFDNDGMEGFYVPESSFRDFVKDAGANTVQQNISFESEDGYGSGISGEAIACLLYTSNQTIVEYYQAYFQPFDKFTEEERDGLRQKLLVAAKMEDDYEQFAHGMEDIDNQINTEEVPEKPESRALLLPSEVRRLKLIRQCRSLTALVNDEAATPSEKERALRIIETYKKELYNNSMLIKIEKQIDHMEEQKRRLKVKELSFNSYYEFALERIPQITSLEKISFNIRDFAAILKQFYRGGELEATLNSRCV